MQTCSLYFIDFFEAYNMLLIFQLATPVQEQWKKRPINITFWWSKPATSAIGHYWRNKLLFSPRAKKIPINMVHRDIFVFSISSREWNTNYAVYTDFANH